MNNLLKYLLITVITMYLTGCSSLKQTPDVDYITPVKNVSLNVGESAIINGAMENCGREARTWLDVSYLLPVSKTGFFANAGRNLMKSEKCRSLAPVLAVKFKANTVGSENLNILGVPTTIVVSDNKNLVRNNTNFLQSALPNPKKAEPSEPSALDTFLKWVER